MLIPLLLVSLYTIQIHSNEQLGQNLKFDDFFFFFNIFIKSALSLTYIFSPAKKNYSIMGGGEKGERKRKGGGRKRKILFTL